MQLQLFYQNSSGLTPFDFAQIGGHLEIVKLVSSIPVSGISRLLTNALFIECMTPYGLDDIGTNINREFTPLHWACSFGNLEAVKLYIIQFNIDPSSTWMFDFTPLHMACNRGHLEIVKYLVTECGCDFKCVDDFGETPLNCACRSGRLEIVKFLVTQCTCESYTESLGTALDLASFAGRSEAAKCLLTVYSQSEILGALVAACSSGKMDIVKYLIPQCSENLKFLLFPSCLYGQLDIVKFLIDECECDPHYTDDHGLTSLHVTCADEKYLHAKYYVSDLESTNVTNIRKRGKLFHIWQAITYPVICIWRFMNRSKTAMTVPGISIHDVSDTVRTEHDRSQLNLKSCKFDVFNYLVAQQKCEAQCKDNDGQTPLHYACASGQLDIVQYFHREKLSNLVQRTLSDDTPLHLACKSNQLEITKFLLSTGECDPLCKNAEGMTPLEITTSIEIRELLDHFCKGNYPLESVVKVFILGDSMAGKSSMVKALQSNPDIMHSLIGRFQRIKRARSQTAGIDSISLSSNYFGNVVLYDFAGQREFFTSHAAFLQNFSKMPGIVIVVTNISQYENDICRSLQYWVSFILDCCAYSEMKPHIIFVGSHKDQLVRGDIDQKYSLVEKMVSFSKHDCNRVYIPRGIVCLNCTRPVSLGLDQLRCYLKESCNSIREFAGKIDQRCYVLHRYVWNNYTSAGVQGCTLEGISEDLEGNSHLLPSNPTELLPLFQTLHDKAQVLLLKNNQNLLGYH